MEYKKPQSTLVHGGAGIYPLTTADQVILADGSRLEKDGKISADSAADSAKLGGKAPEYYIQPRNLLDNSDFTNPVNQRGQTSYNSVGYTIDRWTKESNAILTIADDCINIDNSANSTEEVVIQKVDSDTAAKLIGKTVTIAICTSDGTVYAKSGVVAYDVPVALIEHNGFTFQLQFFRNAMSYQVARLVIWVGSNVSVKWAALYEGTYTADTLPPYVPKGYAAELAECRLYYRPQQMYCLYCYAAGYTVGVNFEPMRITPTAINAYAQTMPGDSVSGTTNIVIPQKDRILYVENSNFAYGNYYRVFAEFSADL